MENEAVQTPRTPTYFEICQSQPRQIPFTPSEMSRVDVVQLGPDLLERFMTEGPHHDACDGVVLFQQHGVLGTMSWTSKMLWFVIQEMMR
jgi:hypothetical protein